MKIESGDEILNISNIYDAIHPAISKFAYFKANFNNLKREIVSCCDKNSSVLQSNIIGRQLLINRKTELNVYKILGIDEDKLKEAFETSKYFTTMAASTKSGSIQLEGQILFTLPLIILAGEYLRLKRVEEAQVVYFFAFFKPYASIISKWFRYGVNEDRMRYTIENSLTDKSDIRRMESISSMLLKKSNVSLENYKDVLTAGVISDRDLHIIFNSGINSRLNNSIKDIQAKYNENKNKYLAFESSSFVGDDEGNAEYLDRDIGSDAAIKTNIARKAVSKLTNGQIDSLSLTGACQFGFDNTSRHYQILLKTIVSNILEEISPQLFIEFYECLIGSILFHINPETGMKYTGKDLMSPVFLTAAKGIFKRKHTTDKNTLRTKEIVHEMLEKCSDEYVAAGLTKKNQLMYALYMYFVLICKMGG